MGPIDSTDRNININNNRPNWFINFTPRLDYFLLHAYIAGTTFTALPVITSPAIGTTSVKIDCVTKPPNQQQCLWFWQYKTNNVWRVITDNSSGLSTYVRILINLFSILDRCGVYRTRDLVSPLRAYISPPQGILFSPNGQSSYFVCEAGTRHDVHVHQS